MSVTCSGLRSRRGALLETVKSIVCTEVALKEGGKCPCAQICILGISDVIRVFTWFSVSYQNISRKELPEHRIHICFLARMIERYSMMIRLKYSTLPQDIHVTYSKTQVEL